MATDAIVAAIERLRPAAEAELAAAAGDRSLCAIAKSGRSFPAVKYLEGRVAALGELHRSAADGALDLGEARMRWEGLGALAARSDDWLAYQQGGLDLIDQLVSRGPQPRQ